MKTKDSSIGFVLLHGAGLSSWIWDNVTPLLEYPALAIDAPGRGKHADTPIKNLHLKKYVDSALQDLESFNPEKLIIVGHSVSGLTGLDLAHRLKERVAGFVGISAAIPPSKGSFLSTMPMSRGLLLRAMVMFLGTKPPDAAIRAGYCNDLNFEMTRKVIEQFIPESKRLFTDKLKHFYRPANSIYIVLEKDAQAEVWMQRVMAINLKAKQVIPVNAGHLAMISKPYEVATALNEYAAKLASQFKAPPSS